MPCPSQFFAMVIYFILKIFKGLFFLLFTVEKLHTYCICTAILTSTMKNVCSNIDAYVVITMGRFRRWHDSPLSQTYKHDWARHKNGLLRLTNKMSNLKIWKKIQDMTWSNYSGSKLMDHNPSQDLYVHEMRTYDPWIWLKITSPSSTPSVLNDGRISLEIPSFYLDFFFKIRWF